MQHLNFTYAKFEADKVQHSKVRETRIETGTLGYILAQFGTFWVLSVPFEISQGPNCETQLFLLTCH